MKINEILTELKVDFEMVEPYGYTRTVQVYKNPSAADTKAVMNKFFYKAARYLIDPSDGSVWIWDASSLIHSSVADWLRTHENRNMNLYGFTFIIKGDHYLVWSDGLGNEREFMSDFSYPLVKRMFGNIQPEFNNDLGKMFWNSVGAQPGAVK